jgi:hypothetical protein
MQTSENELPLDPRHLEVQSSVPKMISMHVEHSVQTVHLSCAEINTISTLVVHSAQNMHLY